MSAGQPLCCAGPAESSRGCGSCTTLQDFKSTASTGILACHVIVCIDGCFRCLQGLWPNYIKVVPSIALAFTTYELLKEMMGAPLSSGLLLECHVELAYRRRSCSFDDTFTAQLAVLQSQLIQHY